MAKDKDALSKMVVSIVEAQANIIGPVAVERANEVTGLKINWKEKTAQVSGNHKTVVNDLIEQYKELFGQISVEVCKEASNKFLSQLPSEEIPSLLR